MAKSINEVSIYSTKIYFTWREKSYTAHIDVSRTICRRCERQIVKLIRENERIDLFKCQKFLNRLSDFLFILSRYEDTY